MSKTLLLEVVWSSWGKGEPTLKRRTHEVPEESKRVITVRMWDWNGALKNVYALNRRKRAGRVSHKNVVWSKEKISRVGEILHFTKEGFDNFQSSQNHSCY